MSKSTQTKTHHKRTLRHEGQTVLWEGNKWRVDSFRLRKKEAGKGAPPKPMFCYVGEKLPFEALEATQKKMKEMYGQRVVNGVYIAHDSVGEARYIGRGDIFGRLKSHKKKYDLELQYFSFYVLKDKKIERQVETILIHAVGVGLLFNTKKIRSANETHDPNDFEEGTVYFHRKGKMKKTDAKKRTPSRTLKVG